MGSSYYEDMEANTICPYCGQVMVNVVDLPTPTGLRLGVKMCPRCSSRKTIGIRGDLFFEFIKQVEDRLREYWETVTQETVKQ
jgi:ribosomal protein S27AE